MKKLIVALAIVALLSTLGASSALATQPTPFPWGGPWCSPAPGGLVFYASALNMKGRWGAEPNGVENSVFPFWATTGTLYRMTNVPPGPPASWVNGTNMCWFYPVPSDPSIIRVPLFFGTQVLALNNASGTMTLHWNRITGSPQTMTVQGKQGNGDPINFVVANGQIVPSAR
ncbi:MAG: hypothetical protein M1370_10555 [Bacteroidetes bacterium]|nr:hypothetical protein [Bacteroidota bacterium]MCL5026523.1 hypothetical protein [Chloroflexota bacterium]